MTVAFRPDLQHDELLFGYLSRHRRATGTLPAAVHTARLFGRSTAVAAADLPVGLDALALRLGMPGVDGAALAYRHTLLPYYSAFLAPARRDAAMSAVRSGSAGGLKMALGLAAFRIRPVDGLRWCPDCVGVSVDRIGEGCWTRSHQLPGTVVCHLHGIALSTVALDGRGRHEFCAPDPACLSVSERPSFKPEIGATLRALAAAQAALLDPAAARDPAGWSRHYRARLDEVGLVPSGRQVDQERLEAAFRAFYGPVLSLMPTAVSALGETGWLAAMTRRHRRAFHPLFHAMLGVLLDARPPVEGPFGVGPWPCMNRLAAHHGEAVVADMHHYSNRASRVGVFTCGCGHSYTRGLSPAGVVGPPRFRAGGPLLEAALRRLVVPGAGIRSVAVEVGLNPKTLVREANSLGIAVPWSTRPSGRARRASSCGRVSVGRSIAGPRSPSRDWSSIDDQTVKRLLDAEVAIRRRDPPERVTFEALERESVGRDWLRKRARKVPRAYATALALLEPLDDFQRRRVEAVAADMPLAPPWEISRIAGLKSGRVDWVRGVIGSRRRPSSGDAGRPN